MVFFFTETSRRRTERPISKYVHVCVYACACVRFRSSRSEKNSGRFSNGHGFKRYTRNGRRFELGAFRAPRTTFFHAEIVAAYVPRKRARGPTGRSSSSTRARYTVARNEIGGFWRTRTGGSRVIRTFRERFRRVRNGRIRGIFRCYAYERKLRIGLGFGANFLAHVRRY